MRISIVIMCIIFIGPLGCAGYSSTYDEFRTTALFTHDSIKYFSAIDGRVTKVCVNGSLSVDQESEFGRRYPPYEETTFEIRITPPDSADSRHYDSMCQFHTDHPICTAGILTSRITAGDITPGCSGAVMTMAGNAVAVYDTQHGLLHITEGRHKEQQSYFVSSGTVYLYSPLFYILILPAIAFDVITFPIQVPLYFWWDGHPTRRIMSGS